MHPKGLLFARHCARGWVVKVVNGLTSSLMGFILKWGDEQSGNPYRYNFSVSAMKEKHERMMGDLLYLGEWGQLFWKSGIELSLKVWGGLSWVKIQGRGQGFTAYWGKGQILGQESVCLRTQKKVQVLGGQQGGDPTGLVSEREARSS